jgi:hypothetical protein
MYPSARFGVVWFVQAVKGDVVLGLFDLVEVGVALGAERVAGAAGVGEQMVERHLAGHVRVGVVGDVFADRVGELQLSGLLELRDGHRGEHFVHRAEVEAGVEAVGDAFVPVLLAANVGEDHLVVAGEKDAAGEQPLPGQQVDARLERLEKLGFRQPGDGHLGRPRDQL